MRKACEGKPIFYHSQHIVDSEEEFRLGISSVPNKDKKRLEKMLPKNQTRGARSRATICEDKDLRVSSYSLKIIFLAPTGAQETQSEQSEQSESDQRTLREQSEH